jgi:hypothetical protein
MITVILVTGQACDHNDANGLELTTGRVPAALEK